jgi:hypothetical protein
MILKHLLGCGLYKILIVGWSDGWMLGWLISKISVETAKRPPFLGGKHFQPPVDLGSD